VYWDRKWYSCEQAQPTIENTLSVAPFYVRLDTGGLSESLLFSFWDLSLLEADDDPACPLMDVIEQGYFVTFFWTLTSTRSPA
jgi:hypothetical protein